MKQISNYISEKLYIGKDYKVDKAEDVSEALHFNEEHTAIIRRWMKQNDINEPVIYCRTGFKTPENPDILKKYNFNPDNFKLDKKEVENIVEKVTNLPGDLNTIRVDKELSIYTHKYYKDVLIILYKKDISNSDDYIYFIIENKK